MDPTYVASKGVGGERKEGRCIVGAHMPIRLFPSNTRR